MSKVTEMCKESDFVADNTPGYQKEWIRYGYFQLTSEEHIKPYQHIIVMKKAKYTIVNILAINNFILLHRMVN